MKEKNIFIDNYKFQIKNINKDIRKHYYKKAEKPLRICTIASLSVSMILFIAYLIDKDNLNTFWKSTVISNLTAVMYATLLLKNENKVNDILDKPKSIKELKELKQELLNKIKEEKIKNKEFDKLIKNGDIKHADYTVRHADYEVKHANYDVIDNSQTKNIKRFK